MRIGLPGEAPVAVDGVGPKGEVVKYNRRGNLQKHLSRNPLQRFLIWYFHRQVGEVVAASGANAILDVGCGEGFTIDHLTSMNTHLPIHGLDYHYPALLRAKKRHPHIPFKRGDIRRLPFTADSFDLVLCLQVLEHLPDPLPALKELRRVSSRHCLFSVPNEPFFRLANFLRGKNVRAWGNDHGHLHNWTAGQFIRMAGDYFHVERVLYPFPWTLALCHK